MAIVYLAMGSNLQQPRQQLSRALAALSSLPNTELLADSGMFQSKAMTLEGDTEPQADYLNAVVKLETQLSAHRLLDRLQHIEIIQGRTRDRRWGPRTLDLDILLYDELEMKDDRLTLPHPGIAERNFVLYPLHRLEPELIIPGLGALSGLLGKVSDNNLLYLGAFE